MAMWVKKKEKMIKSIWEPFFLMISVSVVYFFPGEFKPDSLGCSHSGWSSQDKGEFSDKFQLN